MFLIKIREGAYILGNRFWTIKEEGISKLISKLNNVSYLPKWIKSSYEVSLLVYSIWAILELYVNR